MKTTKVIFEHFLNDKGKEDKFDSYFLFLWKNSKTSRGLGTWLRIYKQEDFKKFYKLWESQNGSK